MLKLEVEANEEQPFRPFPDFSTQNEKILDSRLKSNTKAPPGNMFAQSDLGESGNNQTSS